MLSVWLHNPINDDTSDWGVHACLCVWDKVGESVMCAWILHVFFVAVVFLLLSWGHEGQMPCQVLCRLFPQSAMYNTLTQSCCVGIHSHWPLDCINAVAQLASPDTTSAEAFVVVNYPLCFYASRTINWKRDAPSICPFCRVTFTMAFVHVLKRELRESISAGY